MKPDLWYNTADRKRKLLSIREAVIDTAWGFVINTPINFAFIAFAYKKEMTALETSIWLTIIFTALAIIRKTWIRLQFYRKYG